MNVKKVQISKMLYCILESPVGKILIVGDSSGLKLINFQDGPNARVPNSDWQEDHRFFGTAIQQFKAYFDGKLKEFNLRIAPDGTPFQKSVWNALRNIPYGETVSYGEIARRIGKPNASRAVGAANAKNPLSIIVPCHRVIGKMGKLVGYGGGLPIKQSLLAHERRHIPTL